MVVGDTDPFVEIGQQENLIERAPRETDGSYIETLHQRVMMGDDLQSFWCLCVDGNEDQF